MNSLLILVFLCGAFFCGAIPTGYLLVKHWRHCDVREIGSGNIGSTNVWQAVGRSPIYGEIAVPCQSIRKLHFGNYEAEKFTSVFEEWVVRPGKAPEFSGD